MQVRRVRDENGIKHDTPNVLHSCIGEMQAPMRAMRGNGWIKTPRLIQCLTLTAP